MYCSPFDVARAVYYMYTDFMSVPPFDCSLVAAIVRSSQAEFVLHTVACIRSMCDHLRQEVANESHVSRIEDKMTHWVYYRATCSYL